MRKKTPKIVLTKEQKRLEVGMFVVPPNNGKHNNLTKNKKYKVEEIGINDSSSYGAFFFIIDNDGDKIGCMLNKCNHILLENWEIV